MDIINQWSDGIFIRWDSLFDQRSRELKDDLSQSGQWCETTHGKRSIILLWISRITIWVLSGELNGRIEFKFWLQSSFGKLCLACVCFSEKIVSGQMTTIVISKMIYISRISRNVNKCASLSRVQIFCRKIAIKLCDFGDIWSNWLSMRFWKRWFSSHFVRQSNLIF
jgi:hypothetical protein